jgi:beta-glucanase (GH16 family)
VRKTLLLLLAFFLGAVSCEEKPAPDPGPQEQEPTQEPEPEPQKPPVKEVSLMPAFTDDFSTPVPEFFDLTVRETREDFRYFPGFPSLSENGKTVLMLRVDPSDAAGAERGAILTSKEFVHYGSYAARIRIPDIVAVQPNAGVCVDFSLRDDDPAFGLDEITLELRLADRQNVYTRLLRREPGADGDPAGKEAVNAPGITSFNAASRFYLYGLDWSEGKVVWWVQTSESAEKTTLAETSENVPAQPLRLELRFYHSKLYPAQGQASSIQAPMYPYELEADWIKYTPSEQ